MLTPHKLPQLQQPRQRWLGPTIALAAALGALGLSVRALALCLAAALGHRHKLDSLPVRWQQRRQQRWQQPLVTRWQADRVSRARHARVRG